MKADKGHVHHRLLEKGFSQRQVALILYVISMAFGAAAIFVADAEPFMGITVVVITSIVIVVGGRRIGLLNGDKKK
jgi:UDP-GlcNAc:undecaprenyl-phosphate/decaprenyl-phosphate GlcNAc-1-phosphate transferase